MGEGWGREVPWRTGCATGRSSQVAASRCGSCFPNAFGRHAAGRPAVQALRERVHAHPPIAAYRASGRWMPFDARGIFRHDPELDPPR